MVDQGALQLEVSQCPSWAASLGYMGVAAAVCLSNWGSAVRYVTHCELFFLLLVARILAIAGFLGLQKLMSCFLTLVCMTTHILLACFSAAAIACLDITTDGHMEVRH